jgi:hypothetical protein
LGLSQSVRTVGRMRDDSNVPGQRQARGARREAERLRKERRLLERRDALALGQRDGCLFCRERDGGFTSREHVIADSLGNDTWLVPAGVVCDRCNNVRLSKVDNALVNFPVLAFMRAARGVRSKSGKFATARFDNAVVTRIDNKNITLDSPSERVHRAVPGGFQLDLKRSNFGEREWELVARALLKAGLEMLYLDHGPATALTPEWGHVRDLVLQGGHSGYVFFPKDANPLDDRFHLTYSTDFLDSEGRRLLAVEVKLFGVTLLTDSRNSRPPRPIPPDMRVCVMEFGG